jgi:hypothetical protein
VVEVQQQNILETTMNLKAGVRLQTATGSRSGRKGMTEGDSFGFGFGSRGSSNRMTRREYMNSFDTSSTMGKLLSFHQSNILQVDEKINFTAPNTQRMNQTTDDAKSDSIDGSITHRTELIKPILSKHRRMKTTVESKRLRFGNNKLKRYESIISSGSDLSILFDPQLNDKISTKVRTNTSQFSLKPMTTTGSAFKQPLPSRLQNLTQRASRVIDYSQNPVQSFQNL